MHAYEFSDRMSPCTALLNICMLTNFWHILYETIWEIFRNDFEEKINPLEVIQVGRYQNISVLVEKYILGKEYIAKFVTLTL